MLFRQLNIRAIMLDMDGVMRIGYKAMPGINRLLQKIRENDLRTAVVTNECRYTPEKIRSDFLDMNIEWEKTWPIHTSAKAIGDFLYRHFLKHINMKYHVGVIGENGIVSSVNEAITQFKKEHNNASVIINQLPNLEIQNKKTGAALLDDNTSMILVIGTVSPLQIEDLEMAMKWIRRGAHVVVSCPDVVDPEFKEDYSICMPLHILKMVKLNAQLESFYINVGKPSPYMLRFMDHQKDLSDLKNRDILFVGDSLNTDMKLAVENGFQSALILTGNSDMNDVKKSIIQPDMIFQSLEEMTDILF